MWRLIAPEERVTGPPPAPEGPPIMRLPLLSTLLAPCLGAAVVALALPAHAAPSTDYEMPFPCGQDWTGTTRGNHSPSTKSIDWNRADDAGDPVAASAPGTVTTANATSTSGYGHYVVIDHGAGESTLYAHLDAVTVVVGQRVDQAAQIGTVGSTGNSTGAHVHYEQRLSGSVQSAWFAGAPFAYGSTQRSTNCVDVPLAANMIGKAPAELVVYRRESRSQFQVLRPGRTPKVRRFGTATDEPVLGDWDGNGVANIGVFSPGSATFALKVGSGRTRVAFGASGDQPVAGDWDGDGLWEVGVRRPAEATFHLRAADGSVSSVPLGDASDLPVAGDWDGDGRTDVGVFDQSTATFTLRRVDAEGLVWTAEVQFGEPGDLPVTGDWDGNLVTDVGVWDPATATFSERQALRPTAARSTTQSTVFGRPR